jgi:hypothetical protein
MCCLITREGRGYFEMLPESQVSARVEGTFPSTSVRSMPGSQGSTPGSSQGLIRCIDQCMNHWIA